MENKCGLDIGLSVVSGTWKPMVLFHLHNGPRRFGELRRLVGRISEKVLMQNLRELIENGIVERRDFHEAAPRVEYQMTEFGFSLTSALEPLCNWGNYNRNRFEKNVVQNGI
jgi:DNA-binding HxlR family transcriptional regulator